MPGIVHVNQHRIKADAKSGDRSPVLTHKGRDGNVYGTRINLRDPLTGNVLVSIVYEPHAPLSCGARAWIEYNETCLEPEIVDAQEFGAGEKEPY